MSQAVLANPVAAPARHDLKAPLRIGVMLDGWVGPAWVARILADIAASSFAQHCLVILNREQLPRATHSPVEAWRRQKHLLFKLYERLDARIMRPRPDAHAPTDLLQHLGDVPVIEVVPQRKGCCHRFAADDLERVHQSRLDVILRFGFNILRGDILTAARHGVWSYHHGDNREYRGGPPMFWEMYDRCPLTGTTLQILTEDLDAGRVIYRTHSTTDKVSYARNKNQSYWKSAALMTRRLRELHRDGAAALTRLETYDEPAAKGRPILHAPSNWTMSRFLLRTGARIVRNQIHHQLFHVSWSLALRKSAILGEGQWTYLHAPRGRLYADPFIVNHGSDHHVFFEDCSLGRADGVISWFRIDSEGRCSVPQRVLQRPYHLSYPCVFEWRGDFFMIPETSRNRTIELYRAAEFPKKWVLDRVLMSHVTAVDATAWFHDGRFWLLTAMSETGGSVNDELFLFHADSPHGDLRPHPANPIVSDVRSARPAGLPFIQNGQLIRPGQDSAESYGRAINLFGVEVLNTREYRERPVGRIEPRAQDGYQGTHTINMAGGWTVSDAWRHRFKFA